MKIVLILIFFLPSIFICNVNSQSTIHVLIGESFIGIVENSFNFFVTSYVPEYMNDTQSVTSANHINDYFK